jgi:hypothetical protein
VKRILSTVSLSAAGAIAARLSLLAIAPIALGCSNNAAPPETPQAPPRSTPSPASITRDNPGGDAADPVKAALERLLYEPIASERRDRWATLHIPLPDSKNWVRIRIWGKPTRATFQYGKDYTAMVTIRYFPTDGPDDPEHCLAEFVKYAMPIAEGYGIRMGASSLLGTWQITERERRPILVRLQEGGVDSLVLNEDYLALMAAYQSWPGTCLVEGFAVQSTDHPDLAKRVRDRWVREALPRLTWDRRLKQAPDPTLMR